MTKIAITGCASRFARVLLPLLQQDAEIEQIVGIDLAQPVETHEKVQFHQRDMRAQGLGELFAGCDVMVHLAFVVTRPYAMPLQEAASINLEGTWNACRAAAEAGVRKLVVSSSIAAYGILPDNPVPLREEHPLRGLYMDFYYSQHKHANEIWLDGLQLAFPTLLISRARPCIVIGPHQIAASSLLGTNGVYFTSAPAYQGSTQLVHEDDLARAFHAMIRHDLPGAYNVVGDGSGVMPEMAAASGLQVVELPHELLVEQATNMWKEGLSTVGPEWISGESSIVCSNDKLRATGHWQPRYSTAEAFAATVAAFKG
ncbi:MAG TPA: NAD-dependent epimerase/dehydratase family protein [Ktedonobacteraceae bacterium]|nr:NAD-dependent epimerase/dehydratase family protein [Ktedonobacteraceae bacterium]